MRMNYVSSGYSLRIIYIRSAVLYMYLQFYLYVIKLKIIVTLSILK